MNFVSLLGRIQSALDGKTRILEVSRPEGGDNSHNLNIPCQYWTNDERNMFTALKEGTLIVVRGRIDYVEKHGFVVIAEQITVVK